LAGGWEGEDEEEHENENLSNSLIRFSLFRVEVENTNIIGCLDLKKHEGMKK